MGVGKAKTAKELKCGSIHQTAKELLLLWLSEYLKNWSKPERFHSSRPKIIIQHLIYKLSHFSTIYMLHGSMHLTSIHIRL